MQICDADGGEEIEVRRADRRFVSTRDGITTHHCFSFGEHYDAANVSFGPLIALNDERLDPGAGYAAHEHRDMDIVTWVLEGTLLREDSTGTRSTIRNGTVQRLNAGTGVTHSESNGGGPGETLRFVQLWFALPSTDAAPSYGTWGFEDDDDRFGFTTVASGGPSPSRRATLSVPGVRVMVGHLDVGTNGAMGTAGRTHRQSYLYVASGCMRTRGAGQLTEGDSVRSTGPGLAFTALERTELLLVELSLVELNSSAQGL